MTRNHVQLAGKKKNGRFCWLRFLLLLIGILLLLQNSPSQLYAQTQTQAYWRHSASRRVSHVLNNDINLDGVDEFLIAAENGRVELLDSVGNLQWSYPAGDIIQAINILNIDEGSSQEIVLAANRNLTLLNADGTELWSVELTTIPLPQTLSAFSSVAASEAWLAQYNVQVRQIEPFDYNGDGRYEILVLFSNSYLQLFDQNGNIIWSDNQNNSPTLNVQAFMQVADLNGDGLQEIALGFFNPLLRFSQLRLINGNQEDIWEQPQPISNRISALTVASFAENGDLYLAAGTEGGQIHLLDYDRQRVWWPRTLNKAITALTTAAFDGQRLLVAGTEVGSVVAYRDNGSRLWTRRLSTEANRPVINLSAANPTVAENAPLLAVTLGPEENSSGANDLLLLGTSNRTLATYEAMDANGLSRLIDINKDGRYELLVSRFATVELLGLGVGTSEIAPEWSYSLDSEPGAILVVDFDEDGEDELVIGAKDGRLHYLNQQNSVDWLVSPGGTITHLALLKRTQQQLIVVIRNSIINGPDNQEQEQGWIDVRDINGEQLWQESINAKITSLLVQDINNRGDPEIIVGTQTGDIIAFSANNTKLWQESIVEEGEVGDAITQLLLIENIQTEQPLLVASAANKLYAIQIRALFLPPIIARYDTPITSMFRLNQPGKELATRMLVFSEGIASGLTWRGIQMPAWPVTLQGNPGISIPANDIIGEVFEESAAESFLVATDQAELIRLHVENSKPTVLWRLIGQNNVTSLYWGNLTGDALPEIVVGNSEGSEGRIYLYAYQTELIDEIPLSSGVFDMTVMRRNGQENGDLVVVTENGVVQLFRAKENRPPLLTNPQVNGQYNFSITVTDVEGDEVALQLEIFNPANGRWESQGTEIVANGNDRRFWSVSNPPFADQTIRYRFRYDDGAYDGNLTSQVQAIEPVNTGLLQPTTSTLTIAGLLATIGVFLLVRQTQLPAARARRFYRQLKNQPSLTLTALETRYNMTHGSQDFLLNLASQARSREDSLVSNLADGLFLLTDRPHVGLPIINGALTDAQQAKPVWQQLVQWQMIFKAGQALLEAPTITEISLLRPQLVHLMDYLERQERWSPVLDALLPIMTNLRDSERVDTPNDRLIYLNEANHLLTDLQHKLPDFLVKLEGTLVVAIVRRWAGLVIAASEELRGQADLTIQLKTKRIVPSDQTEVTLVVQNNGRSPAENIIAVLNNDPGYVVQSEPQHIPLLSPGRSRQITFQLEPQVSDRFRLGLTISYDDRNQRNRLLAFGDMVNLLQPTRDFKPILNPYLPGTPLRSKSQLFFGRKQLFNFIADNAGGWSQRNVLILIGQRRTGKTSTLLRLGQHLPDDLLPVYIDCQSLGVSPGMGALFHDLAWLLSDALGARDLSIEVPPPEAWQADPTGQFQRHFIPAVKALLPANTTLLLVFDEFEAFENLVQDGILPPTFFSFMRHLMQHSEGLSFIFVGTRRLEEMSADYWSVLFNIALYERITYLSEEAAIQLITEPVAPDLIYDDLAIDKILRVTASHPYFVQLVCYTLVKRANTERTGYVTISDVNGALDEMLSLGEVHFAYLWQRSSHAERVVLTAVAHMTNNDLALHPEDIVDFLEPFGIQLPPTKITAALNQLVQREIMREVIVGTNTLYELKIGLVGLWTAQHKSVSRLHATQPNGSAVSAKSRLPTKRL
jgi:outer membrane protein assembly factor BamB